MKQATKHQVYAAQPYETPKPWGPVFKSRKEAKDHAYRQHGDYPWLVFEVRSDNDPSVHVIPPA